MNYTRQVERTLRLCVMGLLAISSASVPADTPANLNTLKAELTTLGGDLNKIGQAIEAKSDITVVALRMCDIGKQFLALGASTKFSDDLDAAIATGAKPLATGLSQLTGGLVLPAPPAPALNLIELKTYKLDTLSADLAMLVNTDLTDTKKTDWNSLQKHLASLGTHLTQAGLAAIGGAVSDIAKTFDAAQLTPPPPVSNSYFHFWIGAKLENPFTITVDPAAKTGTLQPTKSTADGFIELNLSYSYVVRQGTDEQQDPFIWGADRRKHGTKSDSDVGFVAPWIHFPDFNTSVGYVFRGSTASNTFSASTIAGGSDLYAEGALGFPWWRYADKNSAIRKMQSTLDIAGGVVTDKNDLLLHPNIFIGGGFQGAYSLGGTNSSLLGLWSGRIGMARVDHPHLTSGSTVALNGLNEPRFDAVWAPSLGFGITLPVTSALNARFGGNVYFTERPASWNLSVGVDLDIAKFFSALK